MKETVSVLLRFFALLFGVFHLINCAPGQNVKRQNLGDQSWQFRKAGTEKWHPAEVPGDIISNLLKLGEIPDPFYRFNEDSIQWIEDEDWEYKTTFEYNIVEAKPMVILNFAGLDTYADVFLNDSLILKADNMYRSWEVEVSSLLKNINELRVYFHSPTKIEKERLDQLGYIAINSNERALPEERTRTFSRKAPFHYGWDWGPRLVTSGIWRSVELVTLPSTYLVDIFFNPKEVTTESANYVFETEIRSYEATEVEVKVYLDDSLYGSREIQVKEGENKVAIPVNINKPKLWWCNGYGEPHLYAVRVELLKDATLMDDYIDRLGVRSLRLVQEVDDVGRTFYFELNGVPVFSKGANYIPGETLVSRQDSSTYQRVINDAVKANMNMLRVWGGAIYENDAFYDLCDEQGILVWQDFMFACETTPPADYMFESIREEAIDNVVRLRNHSCMALWCGDNENLHAWHNWGWDKIHTPPIDSTIYAGYRHISTNILPEVVREYHPGIAYWSTSPASYPGDRLADRKSGDEHDWTIWFGQKDFEAYGEKVPRFVSEYGVQSLPEIKTVLAFADSTDLDLTSKVMDHRQRSRFDWMKPGMSGNDVMLEYAGRYFHQPQDFNSTVYLTQMMHALALKTGISSHRAHKPHCMGSLYWQLNDCWPTISWASVDYFGQWKAAHYWVRDAFDTVLVVPTWEEERLNIKVTTDRQEINEIGLSIYSFPLDGEGKTTLIWKDTLAVDFYQAVEIPDLQNIRKNRQQGLYITWSYGVNQGGSDILLPERPKNLTWSLPRIKINVIPLDKGSWELTLSSPRFAYGVQLQASLPGQWSDNYFPLVPGVNQQVIFIPDSPGGDLQVGVKSYYDFIRK